MVGRAAAWHKHKAGSVKTLAPRRRARRQAESCPACRNGTSLSRRDPDAVHRDFNPKVRPPRRHQTRTGGPSWRVPPGDSSSCGHFNGPAGTLAAVPCRGGPNTNRIRPARTSLRGLFPCGETAVRLRPGKMPLSRRAVFNHGCSRRLVPRLRYTLYCSHFLLRRSAARLAPWRRHRNHIAVRLRSLRGAPQKSPGLL